MRKSKGKSNCLKVDSVRELKERLKVIEFIYEQDLSTGRDDINGTFQEIHYIHYFEHYLENINNLLFKSFYFPNRLPETNRPTTDDNAGFFEDTYEPNQSYSDERLSKRPVPCRVKLEIQKRIDKLFRYVEIHCRRMCEFLGWEGYNHVRSDDYIYFYQVSHFQSQEMTSKCLNLGGSSKYERLGSRKTSRCSARGT